MKISAKAGFTTRLLEAEPDERERDCLLSALVERNAGLREEIQRGAWQEHNELERGRAVTTYRGEDFLEE
jgi:hypothetical protein